MLAKIVAIVLLGLAASAPEGEREKRQVGCPNTFQLSTNPCQSGQGRVYYPVTGDPSKFVQCDVLGRAYVVQCPSGLVYNQATTSCQAQQVIMTNAPIVALPSNPCTVTALQGGQLYFPYPGDNTRFYECTGVGQAQVLQCPNSLLWDGNRIACVYPGNVLVGQIANPTAFPGITQQFTNPCTPQQIAGNHHYFAHPDPTRFIQCDNAGDAFVVSCPSGLVWNQYSETCASAYAQTVVG